MSTTPNMNLTLPEVLVTSGPTYATQINTALDVIDSHDHTSDKGIKITPLALNINSDLSIANHQLTNLKALEFTAQASVATQGAVYVRGVDLYYRDLANNEIRLTALGNINTSSTGAITGLGGTTGVAAYSSASAIFQYQSDAVTYAKQAIGDLSVYSRAGAVGVVQAVTLKADVTTTAYDVLLPVAAPAANQIMRMNVGSAAKFVDVLGTADQITVTHNPTNTTLSLPQDIATTSSPSFNALTLTGALNGTSFVGASLNVSGAVDCGTVTALTSIGAPSVLGNTALFTGNIQSSAGDLQGINLSVSGNVSTGTLSATGNINMTPGAQLQGSGCSAFFTFVDSTANFTAAVYEKVSLEGVAIQGRQNATPVAPGSIGALLTATMGSNVPFSTGYQILATLTLTPGVWDVAAHIICTWSVDNNTAAVRKVETGVSLNSSVVDSSTSYSVQYFSGSHLTAGDSSTATPMVRRIQVTTNTPVYILGRSQTYAGGTNNAYFDQLGTIIRAHRVA